VKIGAILTYYNYRLAPGQETDRIRKVDNTDANYRCVIVLNVVPGSSNKKNPIRYLQDYPQNRQVVGMFDTVGVEISFGSLSQVYHFSWLALISFLVQLTVLLQCCQYIVSFMA
ncbi:hypothetical protein CYMTET_32813, partial [Cymbomonas tetramitiformis]